jgi:quercetin dioxygenase-like cupin family protein
MFKKLALIFVFLFVCGCHNNKPINIDMLKKSSKSWDGKNITYPIGNEEITAIKIDLAPNAKLPFHCHPYPTIGYVISGSIEVEKQDGNSMVFKKGDVIFELVKSWHRGRNPSNINKAEIIVFYIGQKKSENTFMFNADNITKCES